MYSFFKKERIESGIFCFYSSNYNKEKGNLPTVSQALRYDMPKVLPAMHVYHPASSLVTFSSFSTW